MRRSSLGWPGLDPLPPYLDSGLLRCSVEPAPLLRMRARIHDATLYCVKNRTRFRWFGAEMGQMTTRKNPMGLSHGARLS